MLLEALIACPCHHKVSLGAHSGPPDSLGIPLQALAVFFPCRHALGPVSSFPSRGMLPLGGTGVLLILRRPPDPAPSGL